MSVDCHCHGTEVKIVDSHEVRQTTKVSFSRLLLDSGCEVSIDVHLKDVVSSQGHHGKISIWSMRRL